MSELGLAIPFYSGLEYLRRALDSLRAQSVSDWRAVVVDDAGPEPDAAQLVRDLGDERIRYVRNAENLGLARNWNAALDAVDADAVTLFHADDELAPGYLEAVGDAHRRHPDAVAVHTAASVIGADSRPRRSFPDAFKRVTGPRRRGEVVTAGDEGLAVLLRGQFIFCPSLSYKRAMLPAEPFDSRWRQVLDLDLLSRLLLAGARIVGVKERVYRYRRHDESQTAVLTSSRDRFVEELTLYDEVAHRAERAGFARSSKVARRARIVRAHMMYRALGQVLRGRVRDAYATASLRRSRSRG